MQKWCGEDFPFAVDLDRISNHVGAVIVTLLGEESTIIRVVGVGNSIKISAKFIV